MFLFMAKTTMENENIVLCEKIINKINEALKDSNLNSFEIIPTITNQNKSPVLHVEHNLGLESWCAKLVYDYAHKKAISLKLGCNKYNITPIIIKYINCALLINPDVTTFWHIRRQLVEKDRLRIQQEFQFSSLVLTKKPKANEAFSYRRWLFSFQSGESIDWPLEIGICERCADKTSSNYHAWSHRQWVLQKAPQLLKSEIILTEKFIKKHISDYSCYHYRQFVLNELFKLDFYDNEQKDYKYLKELINYYVANECDSINNILKIMLPNLNKIDIHKKKLRSFLYCCNIASFDIQLCENLKNIFGLRESFVNHKRASLKFIVDNCIVLNNINNCYKKTDILKYNYINNNFLVSLKKTEYKFSEAHKKWCSLFLGFE